MLQQFWFSRAHPAHSNDVLLVTRKKENNNIKEKVGRLVRGGERSFRKDDHERLACGVAGKC